jgi:hypothetical protein
VKKLIFIALAGIVAIGVIAVAVVLLATQESAGDPAGVPGVPARTGSLAAPVEPALPGPPPSAASQEQPPEVGPRRLQLPDRIALGDVTAPIAACLRANPTSPGGGALLTLELEALEGGGLRIVDAPVARWGNASRALVECAQQTLRGRTISLGAYTPGERFRARYELESPLPEPEPPPPSTLPSRRPPQRGAGSGGRR